MTNSEKQMYFDRIVEGLLKQGTRASTSGGYCMYYLKAEGEPCKKCAIGQLGSDEQAFSWEFNSGDSPSIVFDPKKTSDEFYSDPQFITRILEEILGRELEPGERDFFTAAQRDLHDLGMRESNPPGAWEDAVYIFADRFELTVNHPALRRIV